MSTQEYEFKTEPRSYQREKFDRCRAYDNWGHLWEQGTGKSKEEIDQFSWAFENGRIDGMVIVAPDGVHANWVTDEIPKHMPDRVLEKTRMHIYHSKKSKTKAHQKACNELLKHEGFSILVITYDAIMTRPNSAWMGGREYVEKFLRIRDAGMTLDESTRIKSPGAKRTRGICAIGQRAVRRRIYTGTPVPNGPLDIYSQVKFLDPDFWKREGRFADYDCFKTYFGIWREGMNMSTGRSFEHCVGYRNLGELYGLLKLISDRVTKADALDLPDKIYTPRTFELTTKQREMYDQLEDECMIWLEGEESDDLVAAEMPIVKLLRLQQIICGWVPRSEADIIAGKKEPVYEIPGGNPRLDLLSELCEDMPHQAIIWGRFRGDIDRIIERLDKMGKTYARYDGKVEGPDRIEQKQRFKDGEAQFFVANPAVGGQGLTLTEAKSTIYYSNSFDLDHRLQSEDRNHRIGQDVKVDYTDLIAKDTVDEKIITALRDKIDVAGKITGDGLRSWL